MTTSPQFPAEAAEKLYLDKPRGGVWKTDPKILLGAALVIGVLIMGAVKLWGNGSAEAVAQSSDLSMFGVGKVKLSDEDAPPPEVKKEEPKKTKPKAPPINRKILGADPAYPNASAAAATAEVNRWMPKSQRVTGGNTQPITGNGRGVRND
jgi:hypothetical protein